MSTLVLRSVKGSPLTSAEIDANVTNLNTDKADKASPTFTGTVTLPNSLLQVTSSSYPTIQPTLNLDFANTKLLDPRITFVRNSTAAYYDGQTTALAEQNLCTGSQAIGGSEWGNQGSTAVTNTSAAPDGTTTASLLYPNAGVTFARSYSITGVTTTSNRYAYSVYAKASGISFIAFSAPSSGGTGACWFNLLTGTVGTDTTSSASITSIGNGWYRCSFTYIFNTGRLSIIVCDADNSTVVTPNGTSGIYIWGAQLEQRSSVTAYTPTTTAAITNYIPQLMTAPAGVARFDCDPITGKSLGLLIEESRTNLLTYSGAVGGTGWYIYKSLVNLNTIISPEGTLTGTKLYSNTDTDAHITYTGNTTFSATAYTVSCYAKKGELNFLYIREQISTGSTNVNSFFNLSTGTLGTIASGRTGTITSIGNGWYRCSITVTAVAGSSGISLGISVSDNTILYTGDGYSGIYTWGAQLEAGSFATSYIPTVASTVTRAADQASITGANFSSWYNQSQGTVCVNYDFNATSGISANTGIFALNNNNTGNPLNRLDIRYTSSNNTSNGVGLNSPSVGTMLTGGNLNKIGSSYSVASSVYVLNSSSISSYSLATMPNPMTQLVIGVTGTVDAPLNGHIRKLSYYPVALSSSNLVALTS